MSRGDLYVANQRAAERMPTGARVQNWQTKRFGVVSQWVPGRANFRGVIHVLFDDDPTVYREVNASDFVVVDARGRRLG